MPAVIPDEVGPRYDVGVVSPTYGSSGLFVKQGTFVKQLQTQLRDQVIASASLSIIDRDLAFWKRQTQADWSQGEGQEYFSNPSRYSKAVSLDVHKPGRLRMVPNPVRLLKQTAAIPGRGAAFCAGNVFFPFTAGKYCWVDNTLTVQQATTPALGIVGDIQTDALKVFFCFLDQVGVYQTTGSAPNALLLYDSGGTFYGRLLYNQLTKTLYATSAPISGLCRLDKVNAGGAATNIYDFVTGRIEALEMYQGNVIIAWNDSAGSPGGVGYMGRSRLFKYDGTSMIPFADMPDGCVVVGMKSALGILFVETVEEDALDEQNSPPKQIHSIYFITSSTIGKIGDVTDGVVLAANANTYGGSLIMALAVGQSVYFPATGHVWRYDTSIGGLSRSLGDEALPGLVATFSAAVMKGIAYLSGGGLMAMIHDISGGNNGGIFNLNGTIFGIQPSYPPGNACRLISSRIDGGLPYVDKFWFGIEVILDPLIAGDSVTMDYSVDDGVTWVAAAPTVALAAGVKRVLYSVLTVNAHIRYRVKLLAGVASSGPVLHAISPRYAVVNPNASVYRMTVTAYDKTVGRGNAEDQPGYGKDTLDFLDNVARKNELVTFYEPDDSSRTPHSCLVMQMSRPMNNTGSTYDPRKKEGDVDLVLWEAVT